MKKDIIFPVLECDGHNYELRLNHKALSIWLAREGVDLGGLSALVTDYGAKARMLQTILELHYPDVQWEPVLDDLLPREVVELSDGVVLAAFGGGDGSDENPPAAEAGASGTR